MILLDTHALLWLASNDPKLGDEARKVIERSDLYLSTISIWEIGMLCTKDRIALTISLSDWVDRVAQQVAFVPVDQQIALQAGTFDTALHGDAADRLIIATARIKDMPLITADRAILEYAAAGHVRAIDARV